MIKECIEVLHSNNFYNGGYYIEFAKGSNKEVKSLRDLKKKCKRIWQSRKK